MEKKSDKRSRYDISGNIEAHYVDAEQLVLINKKDITDLQSLQIAEEEALVQAYEIILNEVRTDTPMTCELLRHIHARIFGNLYDWAGRWRTVWISKPGTTWAAPDFLEENMQAFEREVLQKYPASLLVSDTDFCAALGEVQAEFLVIHPFREGNSRAIKLMCNLLAVQTNRPMLIFDSTEEGQQASIDAAKAAFKKNYAPMIEIIQAALHRAKIEP